MKRALTLLIGICISSVAGQTPISKSDVEIRTALCQIRNKDYQGAEKTINAVLETEPQNLYARRLAPGIVSYQIRKKDKSPENIARIRKATAAFRSFSKGPDVSKEDQDSADYEVVSLARLIDDGKDSPELT